MKKILLILAALISTTVFGAEIPSHSALMDTARKLNDSSKKLAKIVEVLSDEPGARRAYYSAARELSFEAQQFRVAALQSTILKNSPQIDLRDYRFANRNINPQSQDELSETIVASYMRVAVLVDHLEELKRLTEDSNTKARLKLVSLDLESVVSSWSTFVRAELERVRAK